jgi:hypothetical protein
MDSRLSAEDPEANCLPTGVPRIAPYPWRIVQVPAFGEATHLYFLFEGNIHSYRQIFLDGRDHPPPEELDPSWYGHSIGHWEGDTLVVDTTHISAATFMNNGFDHSDDIHIVERMRLSPDGSTLWITQTYDDPATFDGLAARYIAFTRSPGQYVYPFECDAGYLVR